MLHFFVHWNLKSLLQRHAALRSLNSLSDLEGRRTVKKRKTSISKVRVSKKAHFAL
jgi:hypothetical protein